jgi:hypothetical protein
MPIRNRDVSLATVPCRSGDGIGILQYVHMEQRYDEYFSECSDCRAPRSLVEMVYGEDLLIHPRPGAKTNKPDDVLGLCRHCYEIRTNGRSELRELRPFTVCDFCKQPSWDFECNGGYDSLCTKCAYRYRGISPGPLIERRLVISEEGVSEGMEMWKFILKEMLWIVDKDAVLQALRAITNHYEHDGSYDELIRTLDEIPSPAGYLRNQWGKDKTKDLYEMLGSFWQTTKPN